MRWGKFVQHFEVVVDDRCIGSCDQNEAGEWIANVNGRGRFGPYPGPAAARAAVVAGHAGLSRESRDICGHAPVRDHAE